MLDSILRILALTRKELLAVLKGKGSRRSLLVPPLLQALLFGYAASYDLNHVPYAVLDQDRSAASQLLLAGLDGSGIFERVPICTVSVIWQRTSTIGARYWSFKSSRISSGD